MTVRAKFSIQKPMAGWFTCLNPSTISGICKATSLRVIKTKIVTLWNSRIPLIVVGHNNFPGTIHDHSCSRSMRNLNPCLEIIITPCHIELWFHSSVGQGGKLSGTPIHHVTTCLMDRSWTDTSRLHPRPPDTGYYNYAGAGLGESSKSQSYTYSNI